MVGDQLLNVQESFVAYLPTAARDIPNQNPGHIDHIGPLRIEVGRYV